MPGGILPDYELSGHTGKRRKLSELQGDDPLILTLAGRYYCPKEHQQHLELAAFYPKIAGVRSDRHNRHRDCFRLLGLYNHTGVVVGKAGARDVSGRSVPRWHWGFVGVVIFSLVVTLATRTFHSTTLQSTTVHFSSPQAMRQHMDSDAVGWVSPASEIAAEQPPTFYARMAPAGLPLPTFHIEENLYNRPPPTC